MVAANIRQSDLFELLAGQLRETIGLLDKMATDVHNTVSGKIEVNETFVGTTAGNNLLIALQAEDRIRQRLEAAVRACEVGRDASITSGQPIAVDTLLNALKLSELTRGLNLNGQQIEEENEIELF